MLVPLSVLLVKTLHGHAKLAKRHDEWLQRKGLRTVLRVVSDLGLVFKDTSPESSDSELGDLIHPEV